MSAVLSARDLHVSFGTTDALRGVSLDAAAGEVIAIMGPSGSGKSTLLHCLAGILRPDRGDVSFAGRSLSGASERERSNVRLRSFGFVFQFGDLVPELTLVENVTLPLRLCGVRAGEARRRALAGLDALGVADVADSRAGQASGGQVQRAAVARALIGEPAVVFADEPTGSLDTRSGEEVLDALVGLARSRGSAVVLVTHEARVAAYADRELVLRDGRIAPIRVLA